LELNFISIRIPARNRLKGRENDFLSKKPGKIFPVDLEEILNFYFFVNLYRAFYLDLTDFRKEVF